MHIKYYRIIWKTKIHGVTVIINFTDVTNSLKGDIIIDENNVIYLSKDDISNFYDGNIYYDEKYNQIVTTSEDKIAVMEVEKNEKKVNNKTLEMKSPVKKIDDKYYIPFSELEDVYNVTVKYNKENNTVVFDSLDRRLESAKCLKNTSIKRKANFFSKTLEKLDEGSIVYMAKTEEKSENALKGFIKVRTEKGTLGYISEDKISEKNVVREENKESKQIEGKINLVWDYYSEEYGSAPNREGTKIEGVNVVSPSFFHLEKLGKGKLLENVGIEGENYISWAHSNGYKVWPIFSNGSMQETTSEIMNDYKLRESLINQIVSMVEKYELDGVNIDFENMKEEDKYKFSRFIIELTPRIKSLNKVVSVDVTAPDGAPEWSLCFDRNTIGDVVDYVMFMAYDQNGETSKEAGTVAGYDWVEFNINKFLNQEEVPKEKLVLGIPFYTRLWKESGDGLSSSAIQMKDVDEILPKGVEKEWKENLKQYYVQYERDAVTYKMWIEDEKSILEKLSLVNKYDLSGVCFWVKDYENESLWEKIKKDLNEE